MAGARSSTSSDYAAARNLPASPFAAWGRLIPQSLCLRLSPVREKVTHVDDHVDHSHPDQTDRRAHGSPRQRGLKRRIRPAATAVNSAAKGAHTGSNNGRREGRGHCVPDRSSCHHCPLMSEFRCILCGAVNPRLNSTTPGRPTTRFRWHSRAAKARTSAPIRRASGGGLTLDDGGGAWPFIPWVWTPSIPVVALSPKFNTNAAPPFTLTCSGPVKTSNDCDVAGW